MVLFGFQANAKASDVREIYFAGGCFWGVEEYFSRIPGVLEVTSGYANGTKADPSYKEVCSGQTGHAETVKIVYDPTKVSLRTLTRQFFKIIDPLSVNRQGNDVGSQYRTGLFYKEDQDQEILAQVMAEVQKKYHRKLAVELLPLKNFYKAEEYHQDYLRKNPYGYCHISFDSLKDLPKDDPELLSPNKTLPKEKKISALDSSSLDPKRYQKPDDATLKAKLSKQAYAVTQEAATEPAFSGQLLLNKAEGIYVDVVTGEPLFLSTDKFESGTGWPSFTKPISSEVIKEDHDFSYGMHRIEVRSRVGHSHLGHVFDDGPKDLGGRRYCINSVSLRFIPKEKMAEEGYSDLLKLLP